VFDQKRPGRRAGLWIAAATLALVSPAIANPTTKFAPFVEGAKQTVDHSAWDKLLKSYVVSDPTGLNRIRYKAFKAGGHADLKAYINSLETTRPTQLDRPEQFAYWANLYNAKTIDVVLDAYPVSSIRKISISGGLFDLIKKSVGAGGPWKAKILKVEGENLSLDDIEHEIMRPLFKDPRVHYAVNCASIGCPNLQPEAFTRAKLEAMLDAGAKAFINSPRGFQINGNSITASSIFSWFKVDFGGTDAGVLSHASKYAAPKLKQRLEAASKISDFAYDWSLNDVQP